MNNTPYTPIFSTKGRQQKVSQEFFNELVFQALTYRYERSGLSAIKLQIGKDVTDAIFSLNNQDSLNIFDKTVDGQRFKELFITSTFLPYILSREAITEEHCVHVAIPKDHDSSVDTAIIIAREDSFLLFEGNTARIDSRKAAGATINLQVKELFDFDEVENVGILLPHDIDVEKIKKYATDYPSEFILVYNRSYSSYVTDVLNNLDDRLRDRVVMIGSPYSATQSEEDGGNEIKFDPNKINFLLLYRGQTIHVQFDIPPCLLRG